MMNNQAKHNINDIKLKRKKCGSYVGKRSLDIVLCLIALVVLSPIMLIVTLTVKLTSPGPIIFKQLRVGKNGRKFNFYKFRSMYFNCDENIHQEYIRNLIAGNKDAANIDAYDNSIYKIIDDPRITFVGKTLRKTTLDELPQLINVLKSDMSLVGPRPDPPYAVKYYKEWYKKRFSGLPGMTGLQVIRGRSTIPYEQMVELDIYYLEHCSFWLDLKILFKTIFMVFSCRGTY